MEIYFKNEKEKKFYESEKELIKTYGQGLARKIQLRIKQMKATSSVGELLDSGLGKGHLLVGNYDKHFALSLDGPNRLVVRIIYDEETDFSRINLHLVEVVKVMEVTNYHDE